MTSQFIFKFEEKKKSPPEWTETAQNKKAEMLAAGEAKGLYSDSRIQRLKKTKMHKS